MEEEVTPLKETVEQITFMGRTIQIRSRTSQDSSNQQQYCSYLQSGLCKVCTCDKCRSGLIICSNEDGVLTTKQCSCQVKAYNRKLLKDEGLLELSEKNTFASFIPRESWQQIMLDKAVDYVSHINDHYSFFVSGQSGSGKTHICTAIYNILVESGLKLKYLEWVKQSTRLKSLITDNDKYTAEVNKYIFTDVLYIDDFFKQAVTDADIRLAYEIINERYNMNKPTIISSERSLDEINNLLSGSGEAIGGRIYESCNNGEYCIDISGKEKNQRFYGS